MYSRGLMKIRIALTLLLASATRLLAQPAALPDGILQSAAHATLTADGDRLLAARTDPHAPIELLFTACQGLGVDRSGGQWWVLPIAAPGASIQAGHALWVLPSSAAAQQNSWLLQWPAGAATATMTPAGLAVAIDAPRAMLTRFEPRPHSDPLGHRYSIHIAGAPGLDDALAAFDWGTILPSVAERTFAARFPYASGYVLSTLNTAAYAGSYPAVDHEFQIKGRLALGSEADLDVVRRMIELQFQLMRDDPERLHRAPTSVQPDGRREYHVRRNSQDNRQNAAMFPLTGNIEVLEEAWLYAQAAGGTSWLRTNIANLEDSAGWVLANTDPYGRVWSDVYYEDQVMKDGRVTQAQAFAARALGLLAAMETQLGRSGPARRYAAASRQMAAVLAAPLPLGFWDETNRRFVDWVDRDGRVHDHVHLLANELPVLFGYATAAQAAAVRQTIQANDAEFQRFPSFISANIAAYTRSEIGDGGPYDLCAAGRYWYWDAAFRAAERQNTLLLDQLKTVAAEAARNGYFMGERYDMDHVYYVDGKNAHGAEKYYEYPNVFAAVLLSRLLGLGDAAGVDLALAPHLPADASVQLDTPRYALAFTYSAGGFTLKNLAARPRRFQVDLSALGSSPARYRLAGHSSPAATRFTLTLAAHQEARWTPAP
jgi:hypothetical protein